MSGKTLGIGIDFGTTNSAAAVFDGEQIQLVQLEADAPIMPSATYIDRDLQTLTGQAGIDRYIADNSGRTVELTPEVVGEVSQFVEAGGEEPAAVDTTTQKIYGAPVTDAGLQGRLFRGTKRLLGDQHVRRMMVFDQPFRLVALLTPMLLRMRCGIEQHLAAVRGGSGSDISQAVHLGHPVNFEGRDQFRNKLALTRLAEAYKYAGVAQQCFYPEPIAAAVGFLHQHPEVDGEHLLTFDFGGGTLDLCVLRRQQQGFVVVATHGIGLGGDHIDQLLFRKLLFPLLGQGERWRRRGMDREIETPFPFDDFAELLLNWAVTYTLNQNRYTTPVMECIAMGGAAQKKFIRLRDVIKHNLSYLMFARIKQLKAALSDAPQADLDIPEIDVRETLQRSAFEEMLNPVLLEIEQCVEATLALAGLLVDDIDIVLRTGGSSLI
ncbi:MAG: Hsp70 family protein, partial [Pseudomonadota bacterium]